MRSPLAQLEAELSPMAKHALETYRFAFSHGDPNNTMGELRLMIRKLYGDVTDDELERHFKARQAAVLPKK